MEAPTSPTLADGLSNPYEALYHRHCPHPPASREQAENVARHLGLMHNAFGSILKDLVCLLARQFPPNQPHPVPLQQSQAVSPHPSASADVEKQEAMEEEGRAQDGVGRGERGGEEGVDLGLFRERLSRIVEDVKKTKVGQRKKDRRKEEHHKNSQQHPNPPKHIEEQDQPNSQPVEPLKQPLPLEEMQQEEQMEEQEQIQAEEQEQEQEGGESSEISERERFILAHSQMARHTPTNPLPPSPITIPPLNKPRFLQIFEISDDSQQS